MFTGAALIKVGNMSSLHGESGTDDRGLQVARTGVPKLLERLGITESSPER